MTVMVDELQQWPTKIRCFKAGSCHLTVMQCASDEYSRACAIEELHAFALDMLGMRREWFQDHRIAPHYDLTPRKRKLALECGAFFVPARHQVYLRRLAIGDDVETTHGPPGFRVRGRVRYFDFRSDGVFAIVKEHGGAGVWNVHVTHARKVNALENNA
jgi:hypothetical protein